MLELELDTRREIGGAFQQTQDHIVRPLFDQAAEPARDAGVVHGEILGLLLQQAKFLVEKTEELPIHSVRAG